MNHQNQTVPIARHLGLTTLLHDRNRGYGFNQKTCYTAAVESGADIVVMVHPDYQYTPLLVAAMASMLAYDVYDCVLGSRILGGRALAGGMPAYKYLANRFLTMLSNMFTNLNLTDMETCYKVFRREVLAEIRLKSNRFGFEPEITAKVAKRRSPAWRIYEVPISYSGRTYEEGKKIGLKDAINALYCIVRFWMFD